MKLLADLHISPRTVAFLRTLGHEVVRVDAILPKTASDEEIVAAARDSGCSVLTQDLDFSAIVALSGARTPSLITLRLAERPCRGAVARQRLPEAGFERRPIHSTHCGTWATTVSGSSQTRRCFARLSLASIVTASPAASAGKSSAQPRSWSEFLPRHR
jgi:predicted nuclease of predicted toxin-antitoxin system